MAAQSKIWVVYDRREPSADAAWRTQPADDNQFAPVAIDWLDAFSADISAKLHALPPGDPTSGTTSDSCR